MGITRLLSVGVLFVSSYSLAQCMIVHRTLPDDLRSSLEERVSRFFTAQAEEHWEEVSDLLGRCQRECNVGKFYTSSYKQCLVSRMQEVRLSNFDFSMQDNLSACTRTWEEMGTQVSRIEAEQLPWYMTGTGTFQTSSNHWLEQTRLIAYRDQGQWYFIPPQRMMQDRWEKVHYREADFVRDRQEEIEIRNNPSCPINITDVHVHMDRQHPSDRHVTLKLRNKTRKKVIFFTIRIGDELGAVYPGNPDEIEPRGEIAIDDVSFPAYSDF